MKRIASSYLRELNISISKNYFEKLVTSHPDYPSILSVSDTFERLGIRHNVVRIEKKDLPRVPFPYLLHLDRGAGEFLLIRDQNDSEVNEKKLEAWDGVVMLAEPTHTIVDTENDRYLSEEKFSKISSILFASSAVLLLILFVFRSFSEGENTLWPILLLTATAIGGVLLGYFLIAKDLGIQYEAVDSFCNTGKNANCDRVLTSENATIFGRFKFSDAVLSYFTFQLIVLGFFVPVMEEASEFLWVLSAGGMLAIPVVVYSVYLQGVVLKSWCRLCLLVDAILLIQTTLFGWLAAGGSVAWNDINGWATGLSLFLLLSVGSFIFLIKNRIEEGVRVKKDERLAARIKNNPDVFTHLLMRQPKVDCTPFEQELLIGDPKAPVRITMAASLGCGPCREGFEKANHLVNRFSEILNFSIRLSVSKNGNGQKLDPGLYLLGYWMKQIYNTKDQSEHTEKLLQDWFDVADLNQFRGLYPLKDNGQSQELETLAVQHADWFEKADIKRTPTFFVNGYQLPGHYRIEILDIMLRGSVNRFLLPEKI